jgi:hypothetical protein
MDGVMHLLAHGGMLPLPMANGEKTVSAKRKGVKQGVLLMLIGAILVPIFGVMAGFAPGRLENVFAFFAALSRHHLFCRRTVADAVCGNL